MGKDMKNRMGEIVDGTSSVHDRNIALEIILIISTLVLFYGNSQLLFFIVGIVIWGVYILFVREKKSGWRSRLGLQWPELGEFKHIIGIMTLMIVGLTLYFLAQQKEKKFRLGTTFYLSLLIYPIYGLAQMFFFQSIINNRLSEVFSKYMIVLCGAVIYSVFHFRQCCELFVITFFLGGFYSYVYLTYKTIYPIAVFHGVFATLYYYISRQEDILLNVFTEFNEYFLKD